MKLYGVPASPFVQRVLMVARLKGHELALQPPPGGNARTPEFHVISPLGRIPALEEDGFTLFESGPIAAYFDETLEGAALLPADPRGRARVRLIETLVAIELFGIRPIMMGLVFGMPVPDALLAAGRKQLADGIDAVEHARNPADRFAHGDTPTLGDCALLPMLTLLEIADPMAETLALLAPHPGLLAYRIAMDAEPIVGRSAHEMRAGFGEIFARGRAPAADGQRA